MLQLVNITKDYKVADTLVHALKGVSLNFRENEFVCILGQSGCGKTTLLNIIGGLDHYTEGDLVIDGKSTKQYKDRDWDVYRNHRIGFIFQSYNLIPHQTVLGNVEIALTIAGVSKEERKERAKQALERVGLGNELHKRPNQLSGGQMQRVAIARALVNNPAILLADEPTGALDSKTSVEVMDLIKEIAGERLVVMVTHNPELAEQYASRIVRLKDGLVESDSDPYSAEDVAERSAQESVAQEPVQAFAQDVSVQDPLSQAAPDGAEGAESKTEILAAAKPKKEKKARARMSWLTSLALSARNLLTKKGRTALTSIGGSIGIISVCLVLALSSGFNSYIRRTEEDMLSYYPVQVTESSFDMASIMTSFTAPSKMPDMSQIEDKIYVDSFLTGLAGGMAVQNNVSEHYLKYVGDMNPEWYSAVQYGYGAGLADSLFTEVKTGDVTLDGVHVEPSDKYFSLNSLKAFYIDELRKYAPQYSQLTAMADFFGNIVNKMPGTKDFADESYAQYVLSQYDILGGETAHFPQNENEAVLVISSNDSATDLTLAQLGLLPEKEFLSLFNKGENDATEEEKKPLFVDYKDIIGKDYTLFFNDAIYTENSLAEEMTSGYHFTYHGSRTDGIEAQEGEGIPLKVTAILRLKEGLNYGCLTNGLNITEATVDSFIAKNMQSKIVDWVKNDSRISVEGRTFYRAPCGAVQFEDYYFSLLQLSQYGMDISGLPDEYKNMRIANDISGVVSYLGGDDSYHSISIYAKDFESKELMLDYLDEWNAMCEAGETYDGVALAKGDKITYSDTVGVLMSMVQTMLNAITYVLVAFTAISLVVSSVMIGIITYVSVVERVKEIGVLRSLGARKRDIKNLFNAETFIIGLGAGLFGVVVTYILSIFINLILGTLTGIRGLAALSLVAALVMVCVSVVLTLISGLIPASAAAKKDPVIALRTE